MRRIGFIIMFMIVSLSSMGQSSKLTFNRTWMFTDIKISKSNINVDVNAMIDTGCTYCVIDSTFVSKCGDSFTSNMCKYTQKGKQYTSIVLDNLEICGKSFSNVKCLVVNLKRNFQTQFDFFVGANVLCKESWKFNMNDSIIEICDNKQEFEGSPLKWENDKNYLYIPENGIVFLGKIGKKKTMFYFDTGCNMCMMNTGIYDGPKKIAESKIKTVNSETSIKSSYFTDIEFNIGKGIFSCDFLENTTNKKKYNTINTSFLKGKSFILNYPQRTFYILN